MEESLLEYIETLPNGVQFVIITILICGVLIIPSIGAVVTFIRSGIGSIGRAISSIRHRSEERRSRKEEDRRFRQQVASIVDQIPDIYNKINSVVSDMDNIVSTSREISNRNHELEETIQTINDKLENMSEITTTNDNKLSENSIKNREKIDHLVDLMGELNVKVRLLVDGDLDNFRMYLMQIYNQSIIGPTLLTKRDISIMKTKYKRYRAEGGNGWAKQMMEEIIASIEDEELIEYYYSDQGEEHK